MRLGHIGAVRPITALMLREIATARSNGAFGYFWAVLEPVLTIALLSVILSQALIAPPLGHSFALFYASGVVPMMMFTAIVGKASLAVAFSRPLFTFQPVQILHSLIARFVLATLTQVLGAVLVFGGLGGGDIDGLRFAGALASCLILALGFSALGCFLSAIWRPWPLVWGIVARPLLLMSGVFLVVDDLPDPQRAFLLWNPLAHIISMVRGAMYPEYGAGLADLLFVALVSAIALVSGLGGLAFFGKGVLDVRR